MLMMMQCAQASRDRGINPVFVYGFFGAIVYTLHSVGFLGGTLAEDVRVMAMAPLAVVAMVAVWALGIMHFVGSGGFGSALRGSGARAVDIELMALPSMAEAAAAPAAAAGSGAATAEADEESDEREGDAGKAKRGTRCDAVAGGAESGTRAPMSREDASTPDRIAIQAARIREQYRLSAREAEVMELLARGHSVARIAEMLVVSENTIRTHSKRIYAKLDIHKKQELVDLIEGA